MDAAQSLNMQLFPRFSVDLFLKVPWACSYEMTLLFMCVPVGSWGGEKDAAAQAWGEARSSVNFICLRWKVAPRLLIKVL